MISTIRIYLIVQLFCASTFSLLVIYGIAHGQFRYEIGSLSRAITLVLRPRLPHQPLNWRSYPRGAKPAFKLILEGQKPYFPICISRLLISLGGVKPCKMFYLPRPPCRYVPVPHSKLRWISIKDTFCRSSIAGNCILQCGKVA